MNITKAKVNGKPIVNAQQVLSQLDSAPDWASTVNQVECEIGGKPSYGQFLVTADDYAAFSNGPFAVELDALTLNGFVVVNAQSAARVKGSPVLVTIADRRYLWRDRATARQWDLEDFQTVATAIAGDISATNIDDTLIYNAATEGRFTYDGVCSLAALEDFAFRSQHVLVFDPIADELKFAKLWLASGPVTEDVFRNFEVKVSPFRLTKLHAIKQLNGEEVTASIHALGGSVANDRSLSVWLMAQETSEVTPEVDRLKVSLGDLNTRELNSKVVEYFGAVSLVCGGAVSKIRWKLNGSLLTTIVWNSAPLPNLVTTVRTSSGVRLAQAPVGGVPARTGITPGEADCVQVILAPTAGVGYGIGDLVKTSNSYRVLNWDLIAHGEDGDRVIEIEGHFNNALLIGASCENTEDPTAIVLYVP